MTNVELKKNLEELNHLAKVIWYNISNEQTKQNNIFVDSNIKYIEDEDREIEEVTIKFTIAH